MLVSMAIALTFQSTCAQKWAWTRKAASIDSRLKVLTDCQDEGADSQRCGEHCRVSLQSASSSSSHEASIVCCVHIPYSWASLGFKRWVANRILKQMGKMEGSANVGQLVARLDDDPDVLPSESAASFYKRLFGDSRTEGYIVMARALELHKVYTSAPDAVPHDVVSTHLKQKHTLKPKLKSRPQ